jgi:hypothetical protein
MQQFFTSLRTTQADHRIERLQPFLCLYRIAIRYHAGMNGGAGHGRHFIVTLSFFGIVLRLHGKLLVTAVDFFFTYCSNRTQNFILT